jgi:cytochrome P450
MISLKVRGNQNVGGVRLQSGLRLDVSLECAQLNPKHFVDPETFRPERFIDADGKFEKNKWFVAFNVGPRACIGKNVALIEISVAISLIVKEFIIRPVLSFEQSSKWRSKITREFRSPVPFTLIER